MDALLGAMRSGSASERARAARAGARARAHAGARARARAPARAPAPAPAPARAEHAGARRVRRRGGRGHAPRGPGRAQRPPLAQRDFRHARRHAARRARRVAHRRAQPPLPRRRAVPGQALSLDELRAAVLRYHLSSAAAAGAAAGGGSAGGRATDGAVVARARAPPALGRAAALPTTPGSAQGRPLATPTPRVLRTTPGLPTSCTGTTRAPRSSRRRATTGPASAADSLVHFTRATGSSKSSRPRGDVAAGGGGASASPAGAGSPVRRRAARGAARGDAPGGGAGGALAARRGDARVADEAIDTESMFTRETLGVATSHRPSSSR